MFALVALAAYDALRARIDAAPLAAEERTEALRAAAVVSVLVAMADAPAADAPADAPALDLRVRAVAMRAVAELGEYLFSRTGADLFGLADEVSVEAVKMPFDFFRATDEARTELGKGLADEIAQPIEAVGLMVAKAIVDSFVLVEATTVIGPAVTSDSMTHIEAAAFALAKPAADAYTVSDAAAAQTAKALADAFSVAAEQVLLGLQKAIADAVSASDAATRAVSKALADVVAQDDAGVVALQDYAIDYFEQDYVLSDLSTF